MRGSAYIKYLTSHLSLHASAILDWWLWPDTEHSFIPHAWWLLLLYQSARFLTHLKQETIALIHFLDTHWKNAHLIFRDEKICQHTYTTHEHIYLHFYHLTKCPGNLIKGEGRNKVIFQNFFKADAVHVSKCHYLQVISLPKINSGTSYVSVLLWHLRTGTF